MGSFNILGRDASAIVGQGCHDGVAKNREVYFSEVAGPIFAPSHRVTRHRLCSGETLLEGAGTDFRSRAEKVGLRWGPLSRSQVRPFQEWVKPRPFPSRPKISAQDSNRICFYFFQMIPSTPTSCCQDDERHHSDYFTR